MSPYRRNIMVGVTVLTALVLLGWMIVQFGARPATLFTAPRIPIQLITPRADGVADGTPVLYRGVTVGRVVRVSRAADQINIIISAEVDRDPPLPANLVGEIRSAGLIGAGSVVSLTLIHPEPVGELEPGEEISARFIGLDVLPEEYARLAEELRLTTQQIREADLVLHMRDTVVAIQEQAIKIGNVLDSVQSIVDDPQLRDDLQVAIGNFRITSESAAKIGHNLEKFSDNFEGLSEDAARTIRQAETAVANTDKRIEELTRQLSNNLAQLGASLQHVQVITTRLERGEGTAGLLLNDPRLYQNLVEVSNQLNLTVIDLRRLLEQWEQEGIPFRLW